MDHWEHILAAFFTFATTVIVGWFSYNQKTKNKMTDAKIKQMEQDNLNSLALNNRHLAHIHGALYELIIKLGFDRAFVIQPHPEHRHFYMSVAIEVTKQGVEGVKPIFQNIPISEMASFSNLMASVVFLYYDDIKKQVDDKKALSMMLLVGSQQIAIWQLKDARESWIGSLVLENISVKDCDREALVDAMKNCSNMIQFILPPIS